MEEKLVVAATLTELELNYMPVQVQTCIVWTYYHSRSWT